MVQILSHYAAAAIVFVAALLSFALLFAVFPKAAWTDAYHAAEEESAAAETTVLQGTYASLKAPAVGVSDLAVAIGQDVPLRELVTVGKKKVSNAGSRYSVTVNDAKYMGVDGNTPASGAVSLNGGNIRFSKPGIYRIKVTVGDSAGLKTTAYLFCHAARKGIP